MILGALLAESPTPRYGPWLDRRGSAVTFCCITLAVSSGSLSFLDHSALQRGDRPRRRCAGVVVRLQERKRKQARKISSLPEDDDAVQRGDPLDAEALLAAALAEMPEDYRAWCLQLITTGPEPGIVAGTVRWRSWCLRCWVREFFS